MRSVKMHGAWIFQSASGITKIQYFLYQDRNHGGSIMYDKSDIYRMAKDLRQQLHGCPEVSGQEVQTRRTIQEFLRKNTSLEICGCGAGFYAAHRERGSRPAIALRADYDALPVSGGGAAHLCGHDGHSAALAAVALMLEGVSVERNVFLLWQPAEEIGAGARECLDIFRQESIAQIYGAHNLPGFPMGKLFTRRETFACASCGLTIHLEGKPTHAAYPELGISPATALGQLLVSIPELIRAELYSSMTLCTIIGTQMGQKAFGKAADSCELWLTLRSEKDEDLNALEARILHKAKTLAEENGLEFSWEKQDEFPATVNEAVCTQQIFDCCGAELLKEPMRWSEDFGHYLKHCAGAFFGVGAGEDYPGLHTAEYQYPDELLMPTAEAFFKLIKGACI